MPVGLSEELKTQNGVDKIIRLCADEAEIQTLAGWRDENGFSLLHWAAREGRCEILLRLLVVGKMQPDVRGANNQTPLMWAAMEEELLSMHILIDYGASLKAKDDLDETAVSLVCQQEKHYALIWLLHRGADVNFKNVGGVSPGHWAAFSGAYMILCMLEAYGLSLINTFDRDGLLPVHRALELEYWGTARMCVCFEPSLLHTRTKQGETLQQFARSRCLPQKIFDDWYALCQDSSFTPIVTHAPSPPAPPAKPWWHSFAWAKSLSTKRVARWRPGAIREFGWNQLITFLSFLEQNRSTRIYIALLAYAFAMSFTAADIFVLRHLPEFFGTSSLAKWWIAVSGCVALVLFSLLLVVDPGVVRPNCFPSLQGDKSWADRHTVAGARYRRRLIFETIGSYLSDIAAVVYLSTPCLNTPTNPQHPNTNEGNEPSEHASSEHATHGEHANSEHATIEEHETSEEPETKLPGGDEYIGKYLEKKGFVAEIDLNYERQKYLMSKLDLSRICTSCWIRRDLRTKHCSVCDACCSLMDHHCIWINKCVGKRNHLLFALFILCAIVYQTNQVFEIGFSVIITVLRVATNKSRFINDAMRGQFTHPFIERFTRWFTDRLYVCLFSHPSRSWSTGKWLILLVAAAIHFVTLRWALNLVRIQVDNTRKNILVNEYVNSLRYDHFIVVTQCDEEGLPLRGVVHENASGRNGRILVQQQYYIEGLVRNKSAATEPKYVKPNSTAARPVLQNELVRQAPPPFPKESSEEPSRKPSRERSLKSQAITANAEAGTETSETTDLPVDETDEAKLKQDIIDSVAPIPPLIKDSGCEDILTIRKFIRNPFAKKYALENLWSFITNTREEDLTLPLVDDNAFVQEMRRNITDRRRARQRVTGSAAKRD